MVNPFNNPLYGLYQVTTRDGNDILIHIKGEEVRLSAADAKLLGRTLIAMADQDVPAAMAVMIEAEKGQGNV